MNEYYSPLAEHRASWQLRAVGDCAFVAARKSNRTVALIVAVL